MHSLIQIFQSKPSRVTLTWAWKEEIPIHASQTVPSPLQEGRAQAGAESSAQRGPKVLILAIASRQEAGIHVAELDLHPMFSWFGTEALDALSHQQLGLKGDFSTR